VLKGQLRAGRTRSDPRDPTRYRYDAAAALLHVRLPQSCTHVGCTLKKIVLAVKAKLFHTSHAGLYFGATRARTLVARAAQGQGMPAASAWMSSACAHPGLSAPLTPTHCVQVVDEAEATRLLGSFNPPGAVARARPPARLRCGPAPGTAVSVADSARARIMCIGSACL
jgi:hypothetical protein